MKRQEISGTASFLPGEAFVKATEPACRHLIRSLTLIFLLALLVRTAHGADDFRLRIIALNDFHGNLESPGKFQERPGAPAVPAGGIDALAGRIEELKAGHPNNVVVAAGDLIGASPLSSALFHDEGAIETLNRMGLEISSVGNHEFDKGIDELLRMQNGGCSKQDEYTCQGAQVGTSVPFQGAKFRYLAANVYNQAGKTILPPYLIKTYQGVRIAFIGLTLKDTPAIVTPSGIHGLRFEDEAKTINALIPELKKQDAQVIVVLIHQGGKQSAEGKDDINACTGDLKGSAIEEIVHKLDDAVDLVISGHTHDAYVCRLANGTGRKIPVTSAASYGFVLTSIDLTMDTSSHKVTAIVSRNILIDRGTTKPDPSIKAIVDQYVKLAEPIQNAVVGTIKHTITRKADPVAIKTRKDPGESALGDLIADAQLEYTRQSGRVDVAFMNPGGIRTDLPFASGVAGIEEGKVTYGELFRIQPFGNSLTTLSLTGAQIKKLLEQQFQGCDVEFPEGIGAPDQNRILQVSKGFTYKWNPKGEKCNKVEKNSIKIGNEAIVDEREYRVTVSSFLAAGGDKFYEFTRGTKPIGGGQDLEALISYFKKHPVVEDIRLERIGVIEAPNP
jgi:5'-nucleotidase